MPRIINKNFEIRAHNLKVALSELKRLIHPLNINAIDFLDASISSFTEELKINSFAHLIEISEIFISPRTQDKYISLRCHIFSDPWNDEEFISDKIDALININNLMIMSTNALQFIITLFLPGGTFHQKLNEAKQLFLIEDSRVTSFPLALWARIMQPTPDRVEQLPQRDAITFEKCEQLSTELDNRTKELDKILREHKKNMLSTPNDPNPDKAKQLSMVDEVHLQLIYALNLNLNLSTGSYEVVKNNYDKITTLLLKADSIIESFQSCVASIQPPNYDANETRHRMTRHQLHRIH